MVKNDLSKRQLSSEEKYHKFIVDVQERIKIAFRITSRVSTGFDFIENYLVENPKTDPAYLRSIYILLSFYFELLLKARLVLIIKATTKNDLETALRKVSHDIVEIGKHLGDEELSQIGITEISEKDKEYQVDTLSGVARIKNFADIRYDFIENRIRIVSSTEHLILKKSVEVGYEILKKVKIENEILRSLPS